MITDALIRWLVFHTSDALNQIISAIGDEKIALSHPDTLEVLSNNARVDLDGTVSDKTDSHRELLHWVQELQKSITEALLYISERSINQDDPSTISITTNTSSATEQTSDAETENVNERKAQLALSIIEQISENQLSALRYLDEVQLEYSKLRTAKARRTVNQVNEAIDEAQNTDDDKSFATITPSDIDLRSLHAAAELHLENEVIKQQNFVNRLKFVLKKSALDLSSINWKKHSRVSLSKSETTDLNKLTKILKPEAPFRLMKYRICRHRVSGVQIVEEELEEEQNQALVQSELDCSKIEERRQQERINQTLQLLDEELLTEKRQNDLLRRQEEARDAVIGTGLESGF